MMLNSKTIGNKIAAARKNSSLSQAELAQQVSISSQAVGKWERGESMPDIITLNRLAEIFGVDLNFFSESFSAVSSVETVNRESESNNSEQPKKRLNWDMSQGNWVNADFSGLKGLSEKFGSSNMKNCKFIGSELSGILLKGNNIEGCDFSDSEINGSKIQGSNLTNNQFKNCSLRGTEFSKSYVMGADFSDSDLTDAQFIYGGIQRNSMNNTTLNATVFSGMNIAEITFDGTLEDCSFENCSFSKVIFQNATLINTFFKNNRNLKRIKFIDCKADRMSYEFLKSGNADLSGIELISE